MKKVVIVGASRTPMGGFHGEMSQATAPELGGAAIKGAIEGAGVKNESIDEVNNQYHAELLKNQEAQSIVDDISEENETSFSEEVISDPGTQQETSSDLKEFGVDTSEPDLFNAENKVENSDELLGSSEDKNNEDDDLEIPAFLRRQKN